MLRGNSVMHIPNDDWNSSLYGLLSREEVALKLSGYSTIIVGDINGHLGKEINPKCNKTLNSNGENFLNFVANNNLVNLNVDLRNAKNSTKGRCRCRGLWTWMQGTKRSIIDYTASVSYTHLTLPTKRIV